MPGPGVDGIIAIGAHALPVGAVHALVSPGLVRPAELRAELKKLGSAFDQGGDGGPVTIDEGLRIHRVDRRQGGRCRQHDDGFTYEPHHECGQEDEDESSAAAQGRPRWRSALARSCGGWTGVIGGRRVLRRRPRPGSEAPDRRSTATVEHGLEVVDEGPCIRVAPPRVVLHASPDDVPEGLRDVRRNVLELRVLAANHRLQDLHWIRTLEGASSTEDLIQHNTEGEDVGGIADRFSKRLLGRHVGAGTEDHSRRRDGRLRRLALHAHQTGETEIEHGGVALVRNDDVGRFEITMHDSGFVSGGHRPRNLGHQTHPGLDRRRAVLDDPVEPRALDELHDQERHLLAGSRVGRSDVEQRNHVRVLQTAEGTRPTLESLEGAVIGHQQPRQELDRDLAAQLGVCRHPHRARTPSGKTALKTIAADRHPSLDFSHHAKVILPRAFRAFSGPGPQLRRFLVVTWAPRNAISDRARQAALHRRRRARRSSGRRRRWSWGRRSHRGSSPCRPSA